MISEPQQEQASLYALGLLDADEAAAFEREIDADTDLRGYVRSMQETIARLAWAGDRAMQTPPPELRARVLAEAGANQNRGVAKAVARRAASWFPWAVAAVFSGFAGALFWLYAQQLGQIHDLRGTERAYQQLLAETQAESKRAAADPLGQVSFCALEPTPDFKNGQPRAMVLWDAAHHEGKLRVNRLAPPAEGKDYQLWTVEKGRKEAVNAGVFHVNADGTADVPFQPMEAESDAVVAVAVSLEQAGGSPTNKGPILLLGKF